MDDAEVKLLVLIESVSSLSKITANHDTLLTKLIDDHEQRIRLLEQCSLASKKVEGIESRVRILEDWRWYTLGGIGAFVFVSALLIKFLP